MNNASTIGYREAKGESLNIEEFGKFFVVIAISLVCPIIKKLYYIFDPNLNQT